MDDTMIVLLWIAGLTLLPWLVAGSLRRWLPASPAAIVAILPFAAWAFWILRGDAGAVGLVTPAILFALLGDVRYRARRGATPTPVTA